MGVTQFLGVGPQAYSEGRTNSASPAIDALACRVLLRRKVSSAYPGYIVLVSKVVLLALSGSFRSFAFERQSVYIDRFTKMVLVSCLPSCHNVGNLLAGSVCPPGFDHAFKHVSSLRLGLCRRAPNKACSRRWVRAAFFERFLAEGWFRFDEESALPPTAANARRWAYIWID